MYDERAHEMNIINRKTGELKVSQIKISDACVCLCHVTVSN